MFDLPCITIICVNRGILLQIASLVIKKIVIHGTLYIALFLTCLRSYALNWHEHDENNHWSLISPVFTMTAYSNSVSH